MMTYPTEHSDAEFRHIEPHLPTANRRGRPKIHAPREILNAVFYVLKSVWHPGAVDPHPEYQSFGIDEQMTLSAFDLLGRVEAALVTPYPGGPDRL